MAEVICDKSDRGMTYDEATQCLLELFLESWWMCAVEKGDNGDIIFDSDNLDLPKLHPNAHIHFDNRGSFFVLQSVVDEGQELNKQKHIRSIKYGGVPYFFNLKEMTPAIPEKKDSTGAVIQDPHEFAPHANVIIRHGQSEQTSLGGKGYRSFTRNGLLAIKLEISIDSGLTRLYECANMIAECFEGRQTNNSMWFQSVSINEEGVDGLFYNGEVIVAFEYDQVK